MNHPFVDGNKRTGFVAADTFLRLNGYFLKVDQKSGEETILELASGRMPKGQIAKWFADNIAALDK
ncbi:MAG: type II toxin-antitoxin system death-on-curing family toxin [Planctomycetaceae bacterium]|nr:type II toxin-antitoxin system death-on-curing family toxin [Planctomycetaceae bacterium]